VPEVKKYPTSYTLYGTWVDPDYILGAPDGLCAQHLRMGEEDVQSMTLHGFGFNIPSDAIIKEMYVGSRGIAYNLYVGCGAPYYATYIGKHFHYEPIGAYTEYCCCSDTTVSCVDVIDHEMAIPSSLFPTPDELNQEKNWHFKVWNGSGYYLRNYGFYDACWIRVIYELPPPPIGYTYGNGLVHVKIGS